MPRVRWPDGITGRMVTTMTTCGHCGRRVDLTDLADELAEAAARRILAAVTIPILRRLARIEYVIRTGDQAEMTALDDLRATDEALANTVTDLASSVQALGAGVDKLDAAFDDLKNAVDSGNDQAIADEVTRLQGIRDQLVNAKQQADASTAKIDEDFATPAPGEPGGPAATGESTPDPNNPASIV